MTVNNDNPNNHSVAVYRQVSFSATQSRVLQLASEGLSTREIAVQAGLAEATVNVYIAAICEKLSARNRTHAVALGISLGLIKGPE